MIRTLLCVASAAILLAGCAQPTLRGTGDLGVVIERASGSLQIIESDNRSLPLASKAWATCPMPRWCSHGTSATPTCLAAMAG